MATGQAEIRSVQTTRDGGIVASRDCRFVLLAVWLAQRDRHFACWRFEVTWSINNGDGRTPCIGAPLC